jgi:hypothetical protein
MRKLYAIVLATLLFIGLNTATAQDCQVYNMIGSGSLAFFQLNIGGGRMYVRFDPSQENTVGNPGCNAPYPFLLQTAHFGLIDAGYFSPGEGAGNLTYRIRIYNLANPADLCSGPGAVLATSTTQSLNLPSGTTNIHEASFNFNLVVNNPFFVAYEVLTWTGDQYQVPAPIRNSQAISTCRQYESQNGGVFIEDHVDFFGTGWLNAWITGESTTASCTPPAATFNPICNAQAPNQFFIYANVNSLGSGGPYTLSNNINSNTSTVSTTGNLYAGAFANNSNVVLTLTSQADAGCVLTSAPITLDCSTVDIKEHSALSLTELFPNPATQFVTISNEVITGNVNLQVFDVAGKRILQQNWTVSGSNHKIDITQLPKGVYSFLISNNENQIIRKLVVQ